jgi:hypothetical protein
VRLVAASKQDQTHAIFAEVNLISFLLKKTSFRQKPIYICTSFLSPFIPNYYENLSISTILWMLRENKKIHLNETVKSIMFVVNYSIHSFSIVSVDFFGYVWSFLLLKI